MMESNSAKESVPPPTTKSKAVRHGFLFNPIVSGIWGGFLGGWFGAFVCVVVVYSKLLLAGDILDFALKCTKYIFPVCIIAALLGCSWGATLGFIEIITCKIPLQRKRRYLMYPALGCIVFFTLKNIPFDLSGGTVWLTEKILGTYGFILTLFVVGIVRSIRQLSTIKSSMLESLSIPFTYLLIVLFTYFRAYLEGLIFGDFKVPTFSNSHSRLEEFTPIGIVLCLCIIMFSISMAQRMGGGLNIPPSSLEEGRGVG